VLLAAGFRYVPEEKGFPDSQRRELEGADNQLNSLPVAWRLSPEAPEIDIDRHGLLSDTGRRVRRLEDPSGQLAAPVVPVLILGLEHHICGTPGKAGLHSDGEGYTQRCSCVCRGRSRRV
jgi:hypothetical protein